MQITSVIPLQYTCHKPVNETTKSVSHQFVDYLLSTHELLDDKKKKWDKLSIQEKKWVIIRLAQLPFDPTLSKTVEVLSGSKYVFPAKRNKWEILQGSLKPQDIQKRVLEDRGYRPKDFKGYLSAYLNRLEQLNELDELKDLKERIDKSDETLFFTNWPISNRLKTETKIKITVLYLFKSNLLSTERNKPPELYNLFDKQAGLLCARQGKLEEACLFADQATDFTGQVEGSIYLACARFYAKTGNIIGMEAFAKTMNDDFRSISKKNLFYRSCAIAFAEMGDSEHALQFILMTTDFDSKRLTIMQDSAFRACAKAFAKIGDLDNMDTFISKTEPYQTVVSTIEDTYHACAIKLTQISDLTKALQCARRSGDNKNQALFDCSSISAKKGKKENALEFIEQITDLLTKSEAYYRCALDFAEIGDPKAAYGFAELGDRIAKDLHGCNFNKIRNSSLRKLPNKLEETVQDEIFASIVAFDKFMGLI